MKAWAIQMEDGFIVQTGEGRAPFLFATKALLLKHGLYPGSKAIRVEIMLPKARQPSGARVKS